jgi:hypothetical protein
MRTLLPRRRRPNPAADLVLPRSVGVMIAALGALMCWGALIGIIQAVG